MFGERLKANKMKVISGEWGPQSMSSATLKPTPTTTSASSASPTLAALLARLKKNPDDFPISPVNHKKRKVSQSVSVNLVFIYNVQSSNSQATWCKRS